MFDAGAGSAKYSWSPRVESAPFLNSELGTTMPMDFLRRIEDASFPLAIHEEVEIQCAAVLVAAGLIEANLPDLDDAGKPGGVRPKYRHRAQGRVGNFLSERRRSTSVMAQHPELV